MLMPSQIGRYPIQSELGKGGFGEVFLALDPELSQPRAIKILSAPHDPGLRTRFKNEAIAAASLKHPNIVTIFEYGEQDGLPYIVMEYLDGTDLSKRLEFGPPLTVYQKVTILSQVASALHAAHSHKSAIIHRDVKPANVMVLSSGNVKLMDFGIARLAGAEGTRLTSANVMIGSVSYMAPEQFTAGLSDVLTDIWSFGVLAYELMAERHPFPSKAEPVQVMYQVTTVEPPPVRDLAPSCPPDLSAVISRAMSKDREQRYLAMEDVVFDLNSVLMDLRRAEADGMTQRAAQQYAEGRLDGALETVRAALEVDGQFRPARLLREKLQNEIHQRNNRTKKEAGLQNVAQAINEGDLTAASSILESLCRLDPSDAALEARLKTVERARDLRQHAERLLLAGQRFLEAGDLDRAQQQLDVAQPLDPNTPGLAAFEKRLKEAHAVAQRRHEVAEILGIAEIAFSQHGGAAAAAILAEGLGKYPVEPLLLERQEQYRTMAQRQEATVRRALVAIQGHLAFGQTSEARALLQDALRQYPGHAALLAVAEEIEAARELVAEETERPREPEPVRSRDQILMEIRRLFAASEPQQAAELARQALASFPDDEEFQKLVDRKGGSGGQHIEPLDTGGTPHDDQNAAHVAVEKPPPKPSRWVWAVPLAVGSVALAGLVLVRVFRGTDPPARTEPERPAQVVASAIMYSIDPPNLRFGPDDPPRQAVRIRPGLQVKFQTPQWLKIEESAEQDATVLTVSLVKEKCAGRCDAQLALSGPGNFTGLVPVSATVAVEPKAGPLVVRPHELQFRPDSTTATVALSGAGASRDVRIEPDSDWISVDKAAARTPAVVRVTVRPGALAEGEHSGNLAILAGDSRVELDRVRVLLRIEAKPPITVEPKPVVSDPKPPPPPPPVVKQGWKGGFDGQLRVSTPIQPGGSMDLTAATPAVTGSRDFPWQYETMVKVQVISPASASIEVQPGKANSWNLIRIRAGNQPVQSLALTWHIAQ